MTRREPERHLRILLIESDAERARRIQHLLDEYDPIVVELEVAAWFADAMLLLRGRRFDVVLVDLDVAKREGLTTLAQIGTQSAHLPVIVLSDSASEELPTLALRLGAQDYLPMDALEPEILGRTLTFALEREALRRQLAARADQLDEILETVPDPVVVVQPSGRLMSWNGHLERVTGYSAAELGSMNLFDLAPPGLRSPTAQPAVGFASDGRGETLMPLRTRHQGVLDYVWTTTPLRDEAGKTVGHIGFGKYQRRSDAAEAEANTLAEQVRQLHEANETKAARFRQLAHEMAQPLTPLNVQTHLLQASPGAALGPVERGRVEVIERNLQRLGGLVRDMLACAQDDAGRLAISPRPADVAVIMQDVVKGFAPSALKVRVRVETSSPDSATADIDATRLREVLLNLLSSALKRTPEGGTIRVQLSSRPDGLMFTVTDDGQGFTPSEVEGLFMPFQRTDHERGTAPDGRGLGLFISKVLVERHGGRLWCESEGRGKGATFAFSIPRPEPVPDDAQAAGPHDAFGAPVTTARPLSKLLDNQGSL